MLQFNLLPDVKKEYVKAKRTKRLIVSVSFLVSAVSIGIVALLFSVVQIAQKQHISDLTEDIKASEKRIQSIEDINKMLTVQNQLSLLPELHEDKPKSSRLFNYVAFLSPEKAKVSNLNFDATSESLILQGSADSLATVNKFVDNIKAVRFKEDDGDTSGEMKAPFTQVATELSGDNELASFKIEMEFDQEIFDNTKEILMTLQGQSISTKPASTGGQQ
jgi:Tfp pilus assembly protein PilN